MLSSLKAHASSSVSPGTSLRLLAEDAWGLHWEQKMAPTQRRKMIAKHFLRDRQQHDRVEVEL